MENSKSNGFEIFFSPHPDKVKKYKIFLTFLIKIYPNLFTEDKKKIKPLALNIRFQLKNDFKEKKLDVFSAFWKENNYSFLRWYTHNQYYYLAVLKNQNRYNLDGKAASVITPEHKDYSCMLLKESCKQILDKDPSQLRKSKFLKVACKIINQYENSKKEIRHD